MLHSLHQFRFLHTGACAHSTDHFDVIRSKITWLFSLIEPIVNEPRMSREWPRTLICCSFFMLFLLLFFSRWSHTCVDFGDADKFSCILKANVVTGSQITDGYISNKKKNKLTDSILTLYRWQKFWNKKSHSKSETKVKFSTSWLIIM